jgi:hypothetical protein
VEPRAKASSFLYRALLAGGPARGEEGAGDGMETILFRDVFSPFLSRTSTKVSKIIVLTTDRQVMIFLAFAGYVAVSVAGIWQLVPGLEITKLVSDYSGLHDYFAVEDRLFRDHPYRLQVVIAEPLDYHEPAVQDQVFGLLQRLEELPWVSNNSEFRLVPCAGGLYGKLPCAGSPGCTCSWPRRGITSCC